MLLLKFYQQLLKWLEKWKPFEEWHPDLTLFRTQVKEACEVESWELANQLIPSLVEHKRAFTEKQVLDVLNNTDIARKCHLLESWSQLNEEDRISAFAELCTIASYGHFLYLCSDKYEVVDDIYGKVQTKTKLSGIDLDELINRGAENDVTLEWMAVGNELTEDQALNKYVMHRLHYDLGWDRVRQCLEVFQLPPAIYTLFDQFVKQHNASVGDDTSTTTTTTENKSSSSSSSSSLSSAPQQQQQPELSMASLAPKSQEDMLNLITVLAPVMIEHQKLQQEIKRVYIYNDLVAFEVSANFPLFKTGQFAPRPSIKPTPSKTLPLSSANNTSDSTASSNSTMPPGMLSLLSTFMSGRGQGGCGAQGVTLPSLNSFPASSDPCPPDSANLGQIVLQMQQQMQQQAAEIERLKYELSKANNNNNNNNNGPDLSQLFAMLNMPAQPNNGNALQQSTPPPFDLNALFGALNGTAPPPPPAAMGGGTQQIQLLPSSASKSKNKKKQNHKRNAAAKSSSADAGVNKAKQKQG